MIPSTSTSSISQSIIQWATTSHLLKYRKNKYFKNLELDHLRFYKALLQTGKSYNWPKLPLYEWSRRVEYPFIIENLNNIPHAKLLDAGSGVTFLPYHLIKRYGFDVECLDSNDSFGYIMNQTIKTLFLPRVITYHVFDLSKQVNLPNESYDVVLSVSVIEHIKPEKRLLAFSELWRLVKKGGKLIVTLDVALDNHSEGIGIQELGDFLHNLANATTTLPTLGKIPRNSISSKAPYYSILPVIFKKKGVIHFGLRSLYYDFIKKPLPSNNNLSCLLICIQK